MVYGGSLSLIVSAIIVYFEIALFIHVMVLIIMPLMLRFSGVIILSVFLFACGASTESDYQRAQNLTDSWLEAERGLVQDELNRLKVSLKTISANLNNPNVNRRSDKLDLDPSYVNMKNEINGQSAILNEIEKKRKIIQGSDKEQAIKIIEASLKKEIAKLEEKKAEAGVRNRPLIEKYIDILRRILDGAKK